MGLTYTRYYAHIKFHLLCIVSFLFRPHIIHGSSSILLVKNTLYHQYIKEVKDWYFRQHNNWHEIEGTRNRWNVWKQVDDLAHYSARQIQQYLIQVTTGI